jgi:hypothetical protein
MDAEFSNHLGQLRQAMAAPVSKECVKAHVVMINEAIVALQGIRDGFEGCRADLEVEEARSGMETAEHRLAAVNSELAAMGGKQEWHNVYTSIPENAVDSKEYYAKLDEMERNMSEVLEKEKKVEEHRTRLLTAFPVVHPHNIQSIDHSLINIQSQKDQINVTMMNYMAYYKPFDSEPYLQKKRALLDEKLDLLKRLRRAEQRAIK